MVVRVPDLDISKRLSGTLIRVPRLVCVQLQRRRRALMSHDALDVIHGQPTRDEPSRVRVPKVVKPQAAGCIAGHVRYSCALVRGLGHGQAYSSCLSLWGIDVGSGGPSSRRTLRPQSGTTRKLAVLRGRRFIESHVRESTGVGAYRLSSPFGQLSLVPSVSCPGFANLCGRATSSVWCGSRL